MEEKPQQQPAGFTQDQLAAIIGTKELEIIALRLQLNQARQHIAELEGAKPILEAVR